MPELPEVETTRRGLTPHLIDQTISEIIIRESRLRWPVPHQLASLVRQQTIINLSRRAKYLLLQLGNGHLLLHLGMSGSLRLLTTPAPPGKHDHVDILLDNGCCLRFNDPRRFGAVLWIDGVIDEHPLLRHLGPEPFDPDLTGLTLQRRAQRRRLAIKSFIMDHRIVVGVGNIYANEALFMAGIHPLQPAGSVTLADFQQLLVTIREVLSAAINQGGTTLRNFVDGNGNPGYFAQQLQVYGRSGLPCLRCATTIQSLRIGQRSTFLCPHCQPL